MATVALVLLVGGGWSRIYGQVQDAAAVFAAGKRAMAAGELGEAAEDFRRVIGLDPGSGAAHINLGVVYMRDKRFDDALGELHAAQRLLPHEPGVWLNLGLVYYRKNDFAAAIGPLNEAVAGAPDGLQARYLLGLCYFFTNDYKQAAEMLGPLWDRELTNLNYLYVVSIAASKSGDAALQKRAVDQMLAIGQGSPEFHLYVGKAWLAENETAKAIAEFRVAAAARPTLPLVHYFLGRSYLEQHDYVQAKAELEQDIAVEPGFAYDYEDLGILYVEQNQPEKAEGYFREAVARNGLLVNSYYGLAKIYHAAGREREALAMVDKAMPLAKESASLHFTRGQVLQKLGRAAEAKREFAETARLQKSANDRLRSGAGAGDEAADAEAAQP